MSNESDQLPRWSGYWQHREIDLAIKYAEKYGLCPVCKRDPVAYGITCGSKQCVTMWLNGKKDPCIGLVMHGIQKYESDLVIHVCYKTGELFSFAPADAITAIESGKHIRRAAYQIVKGKKQRTAGGYAIPPSEIRGCATIEIPKHVLSSYPIKDSMSTSNKGSAAQSIAYACILLNAIPQIKLSISEVKNKSLQIKGQDLIVTASGAIEIKCDLPGGSKARGGSGNLFLQVCESNPNKRY